MRVHFILYVENQEESTRFYRSVLDLEPVLEVAGMTEFQLNESSVLGLMPETGIKKLLGPALPDPKDARGMPRAEIYLVVSNAKACYDRAMANGAKSLSELAMRDWGQQVAYCLDLDGHVLAFAEAEKPQPDND
jgi:catechol 2,3-dioxygenase-like lactoylglutathione lyase family enzyme